MSYACYNMVFPSGAPCLLELGLYYLDLTSNLTRRVTPVVLTLLVSIVFLRYVRVFRRGVYDRCHMHVIRWLTLPCFLELGLYYSVVVFFVMFRLHVCQFFICLVNFVHRITGIMFRCFKPKLSNICLYG